MPHGLLYVASSWRNLLYEGVLAALKAANVPYYDFRHTAHSFGWHEIDTAWKSWSPRAYRSALDHPIACTDFRNDMDALTASTRLLLVLPCGRSAHLALGWAIGAGKETIIYYPEREQLEPELMYKAATYLCVTMGEELACLGVPNP